MIFVLLDGLFVVSRRLAALLMFCVPLLCAAANMALLLSPTQLRAQVEAALRLVVQTPFSFEALDVSVTKGLLVRGFEVADGTGQVAVTVGELRFKVDWLRMSLGAVIVERPHVRIHRDESGEVSLAGVFRSTSGPGGMDGLPALQLAVRDGHVSYTDATEYPTGKVVRIEAFNARLQVHPQRGLSLQATFFEPHRLWKAARLEIQAPPSGLPLEARLEIDKAHVADRDMRAWDLLPPKARRVFEKIQPFGVADLDLKVRLPALPDAEPEIDGQILVHNAGMRFIEFPYEARDVRGRLVLRNGLLRLVDCVGTRGGGTFRGNGDVILNPPGVDNEIDLLIDVENLPIDEALVQAIPGAARSAISQFSPRGRVDGQLRLFGLTKPHGIPDEIRWEADARVRDLSARFSGFGVPVSQLHGRLLLKGLQDQVDVQIVGLRGRALQGEVEVQAHITQDSVDVTIDGSALHVDSSLAEHLDGDNARIVDLLAPRGLVDAHIGVFDDDEGSGDSRPIQFTADVSPRRGMQVRYAGFPYALELQRCDLQLHDGGAVVRGAELTSVHASPLVVSVTAEIGPGGQGQIDLAARGLRIDAAFRETAHRLANQARGPSDGALGAEAMGADGLGAVLTAIGARGGTIDELALQVLLPSSALPDESSTGIRVRGQVACEDLHCEPAAFPYPFTGVRARIRFDEGKVEVEALRARAGTALIAGQGVLARAEDVRTVFGGVVRGLTIDERFVAALPRPAQRIFEQLGPTGLLSADVTVTGAGGQLEPKVAVDWRGALLPAEFPYPITNGVGSVELSSKAVVVRSLAADLGSGRLVARGDVDLTALAQPGTAARKPPVVLYAQVEQLALDAALCAALPGGLGRGLRGMEPQGTISAEIKLSHGLTAKGDHDVVWDASVRSGIERIDVGVLLREVRASTQLAGRVRVGADGSAFTMHGPLTVREMTWNGQAIRAGHATVSLGDGSLELAHIRAQFLDGLLRGSVFAHFGDSSVTGVELELAAGRLERLKTVGKQTYSGRIDGHLALVARAAVEGKPSEIMGSGQLELSTASLWPIEVAGIPFVEPIKIAEFDRARVDLRVQEFGMLRLDRVEASTPNVSLVGNGTIQRGLVDIRLAGIPWRSQHGVPFVEDVEAFFQALVGKTLFGVRIRGPLATARARPEPFQSVWSGLDELRKVTSGWWHD